MSAIEVRARHFLDNWKLWVGIAYFGMATMVVALFFLNRDISREQAKSAAESRSQSVAAVNNCYEAIRNAPSVRGLLAAIELAPRNSIEANEAAIAASDPGDPLIAVRKASVVRSQKALATVQRSRRKYEKTIPSQAKCDALATKLDVERR